MGKRLAQEEARAAREWLRESLEAVESLAALEAVEGFHRLKSLAALEVVESLTETVAAAAQAGLVTADSDSLREAIIALNIHRQGRDLEHYTFDQLKALCRIRRIAGGDGNTKHELATRLVQHAMDAASVALNPAEHAAAAAEAARDAAARARRTPLAKLSFVQWTSHLLSGTRVEECAKFLGDVTGERATTLTNWDLELRGIRNNTYRKQIISLIQRTIDDGGIEL